MVSHRLLTIALVVGLQSGSAAADVVLPPYVADALKLVEDRAELGPDDEAAYYGLLEVARRTPPEDLFRRAMDLKAVRVSQWHAAQRAAYSQFYELLNSPKEFRGQPVALSGHVIRAIEVPADENPYGIERLYEFWLVTDDSQQHPAVVITTEKPEGFPLGESLVDHVSATGLFLKLWLYPSRDQQTRLCPLILARSITWQPRRESSTGWWFNAGLVIAALAVMALMMLTRSRRPPVTASSADEYEPPDFSALAERLRRQAESASDETEEPKQ
jgi:hypothetical protein